jgi:WD40 repeat protein
MISGLLPTPAASFFMQNYLASAPPPPARRISRFARNPFRALWLCLVAALVLAGCSGITDGITGNPAAAPTLTATPDVLGFQAIAPKSCLIADWAGIQTNKRQGNLLAWHPTEYTLAYLAPSVNTNWYTGLISLAAGPNFSEHKRLSETLMASGDLTWSPNGERLAFLSYRVDEGIETVQVAETASGAVVDLFPLDTARTDARTSQKSILYWLDNDNLTVIYSCGEDCQQRVAIDLVDNSSTPLGQIERKNAASTLDRLSVKTIDGLEMQSNVLPYDTEQYPRVFNSPNWSPDGTLVTYLDRRGLLWLLKFEDKTIWLLDIGFREVNETRWSPDGKYYAVRAEDRIYVFEIDCQLLEP